RDAGHPTSIMDPEGLERSALNIAKRCIAAKELPAAIVSIFSLAVILRDRAYIEFDRFYEYIQRALSYVSEMQGLIASEYSRAGCRRELLRRIEHQVIFLHIRLAADLGE